MLGNHITVKAPRPKYGVWSRWAVVDAGTGGQVQFSKPESPMSGKRLSIQSLPPVGLTALAYRTPDEIWISGGSGNLLCSFDGGKTWAKDREVEDVPSNL